MCALVMVYLAQISLKLCLHPSCPGVPMRFASVLVLRTPKFPVT